MTFNLIDDIWSRHVVDEQEHRDIVYVDLNLLHEVNTARAFDLLNEKKIGTFLPLQQLAIEDHNTPTKMESNVAPAGEIQRKQLRNNCKQHQIPLIELGSNDQGIVHVTAPELGRVYPNQLIVCCDSHTSTLGAFGALAFGIGTSQVAEVLSSQSLVLEKPKTLGVEITGDLPNGVFAKDIALGFIAKYGTKVGQGFAIEFFGDTIRSLSMDERATLCNMAIEAGSRSALIASDETTINWLIEHNVPSEKAIKQNPSTHFDKKISFDISKLEPQITWGTDLSQTINITAPIPSSAHNSDQNHISSLNYMDVESGEFLEGKIITNAFLGSCTNSRLTDLELAAQILKSHRVHPEVHFLVVPGSMRIWREAKERGILKILHDAGADVRNLPGCSMCCGLNDDSPPPGSRVISSSNRNFENRQGKGVRTHLASPATVVSSAIFGRITNPQRILNDS